MRRVTRITGVGLGVEAGMILGTAGLALLVRMLKIKCGHLFLYTFEMKYFMQGVINRDKLQTHLCTTANFAYTSSLLHLSFLIHIQMSGLLD